MPWLKGKRILVVEDEVLIAVMVEDMLSDLGVIVIGPAGSIDEARELIEQEELDGAVLDVNVRGNRIDSVAELLRQRAVPMLFATGYGRMHTIEGHQITVIDKPYSREKLVHGLAMIFGIAAQA